MNIRVKKLNPAATLPTYGSEYAAGADLYACIDAPVTINPHETKMIKTGLAMEIPAGYAGLIYHLGFMWVNCNRCINASI